MQVGARLGRDIVDSHGAVLLSAGSALTEHNLRRLIRAGVGFVYTAAPDTGAADRPGPDRLAARDRWLVQNLHGVSYAVDPGLINTVIAEVEKAMASAKLGQALEARWAQEVVDVLLGEVLSRRETVTTLHHLKTADSYTFAHSVSVAVAALALAVRAGYPLDAARELGLASLLHDVGKSRVRPEVLFKPGRLDGPEWEEMRQHSRHGFDILRQSGGFSDTVCQAVLQHHERWDGGGYPQALKGRHISRFARLVSVVDAYDAITSDRVYRQGVQPYEAVEAVVALQGSHFDPEAVRLFLENVQIYPVGTLVELSTGEAGVVAQTNAAMPTRPIVRLLFGPDALPLPRPRLVDLAEEPSLLMNRILGADVVGVVGEAAGFLEERRDRQAGD